VYYIYQKSGAGIKGGLSQLCCVKISVRYPFLLQRDVLVNQSVRTKRFIFIDR